MKVSVLKKEKRFDSSGSRSLGIQTYGAENDYPQDVMEVVASSVTGGSCVSRYSDFLSGKGFTDEESYQIIVNPEGETCDHILQLIAKDFAMFGGFAIHINYNANFLIDTLNYIPFESIRLEQLDEAGRFERYAIHPDWGKRNTANRKWKKDDIEFIDMYNPTQEAIEEQVEKAGSWANYKGQIYYYSNKGKNVYPLPIFDNALTDMNTEEGISNILNRNARNNFLPAGMVVDIFNSDQAAEESSGEESDTEKSIKEYQGDSEALKLIYIQVESKEEIPQFVPFRTNNYDKEFTVSKADVKDSIGRSFNQPPILRAENVGAGFGADLMEQAYDYYNSVTENERLEIERTFVELFKSWKEQIDLNFQIDPLAFVSTSSDTSKLPTEILATLTVNEKRKLIGFEELKTATDDQTVLAEKIGVGGTQSLVEITSNPDLSPEQKRGMLKVLFALTDDQINLIIPQ